MIRTLDSRGTGLSLSPQIWLTVFLGNAHYSPSASLHWGCIVPRCINGYWLMSVILGLWVGGGVDIFSTDNDEGEHKNP